MILSVNFELSSERFIAKGHRSTRFKKQYPFELGFYRALFLQMKVVSYRL